LNPVIGWSTMTTTSIVKLREQRCASLLVDPILDMPPADPDSAADAEDENEDSRTGVERHHVCCNRRCSRSFSDQGQLEDHYQSNLTCCDERIFDAMKLARRCELARIKEREDWEIKRLHRLFGWGAPPTTSGAREEGEEGSPEDDPAARLPSHPEGSSVRATIASSHEFGATETAQGRQTLSSATSAPTSTDGAAEGAGSQSPSQEARTIETTTSPADAEADGVEPPNELPAVGDATSSHEGAQADAALQSPNASGKGATGPEGRAAKRHRPENFRSAGAGQAQDVPGGL
jgi:hypothetical protein